MLVFHIFDFAMPESSEIKEWCKKYTAIYLIEDKSYQCNIIKNYKIENQSQNCSSEFYFFLA